MSSHVMESVGKLPGGQGAGLSAFEVLLVVPPINGELVFNWSSTEFHGHGVNAVSIVVAHRNAAAAPSGEVAVEVDRAERTLVLRHVHLERHVVRGGWCSARAVGRALSETEAVGHVFSDWRQDSVVPVVWIATLLSFQILFGIPVAAIVGAVEEDVVSTCAFEQVHSGTPDAVSVVVGQSNGLGVAQHSAAGVHAIGSHFDVRGVHFKGHIIVEDLIRTSIARVVAHHRKLSVGVECQHAVRVSVGRNCARLATCEVLLLAPAVKGELVLDCSRVQRQGHSPHTIPVVI